MATLEFGVINQTSQKIGSDEITDHLSLVLHRLGVADRLKGELILVEDQTIRQLNKKFRGKAESTDVLSFPQPTSHQIQEDDGRVLGSIIISIETAQLQADQASISLLNELKMLASHGLLHLLGYDHH